MPVARSQGHAGRALAVAAAGVVVAIAVAVAISVMASRETDEGRPLVDVRLGDDTFQGADADDSAEQIADGGPLIFSDVAGGNRHIWLQHLGDDPDQGWYAFDVLPPGSPDDCFTEWDADDEVFVATCDDREFPADGQGLPQYPVTVDDGRLDVDLNAADRD